MGRSVTPGDPPPRVPGIVRAAVVVATIAVAILGTIGITAKSLSLDELATLRYASLPVRRLVALFLEEQANMSLYYAAMWPWVRLSDTELWLRLPSLVAAVASVPTLFLVGRRLVGVVPATVAVLLFATSGLVVEFAQTARSYSIATLAVLVATWAYLHAREAPTRWRLAGYVLAVTAATYLHFLCAMIVVAHVAHALASGDLVRDGRRWLVLGIALALTCGPLLVLLVIQDAGQVDWIPEISGDHLARVLMAWLGGAPAIAVALAAGLLAGLAVVIRQRHPEQVLIVTWALLAIVALIGISIIKPFLVSRYLLFTVPAVGLLVGMALARVPPVPRLALLSVLIVLSLTGVAAWYTRPTPQWREVAEFMVRLRGPKDIVLYDVPYSQPAVEDYARRIDGTLPAAVTWDQLARHPQRKLWVVIHLRDPLERAAIEARLDGTWELFRSYGFDGVSVRRYVPVATGDE